MEIIDYDYFLAHDDIGNELKPILGILREKFPKKPNGTVGTNIEKLVRTFQNGQLVEVSFILKVRKIRGEEFSQIKLFYLTKVIHTN